MRCVARWTAMSKRLQKRLTRLSISPSKRLLSKVDRKGAWEVATKLFFFQVHNKTHASKITLEKNQFFPNAHFGRGRSVSKV